MSQHNDVSNGAITGNLLQHNKLVLCVLQKAEAQQGKEMKKFISIARPNSTVNSNAATISIPYKGFRISIWLKNIAGGPTASSELRVYLDVNNDAEKDVTAFFERKMGLEPGGFVLMQGDGETIKMVMTCIDEQPVISQ